MLDPVPYYSLLLLHNKPQQNLVMYNHHHVIMFMGSEGQKFGMSYFNFLISASFSKLGFHRRSPDALSHPFVYNELISLLCI